MFGDYRFEAQQFAGAERRGPGHLWRCKFCVSHPLCHPLSRRSAWATLCTGGPPCTPPVPPKASRWMCYPSRVAWTADCSLTLGLLLIVLGVGGFGFAVWIFGFFLLEFLRFGVFLCFVKGVGEFYYDLF